ncbi:MAG: endolytic transglycosylase MltG [Candidatus Zambryskibacteria bacterium]|nr:endolytic transglycosylase MltG [Candidatus Zambryskibacteria bacterium]
MLKNKLLEKYNRWKEFFLEEIKETHFKISNHPRIIVWRFRFFKIHPILGRNFLKIIYVLGLALILFLSFHLTSWRAPLFFPKQTLVTIERGESLSQIAKSFKKKNIVISDFWLKVFIFISGGEKRIVAGDYYFPQSVNIFKVVKIIRNGQFGLVNLKVTIPEGLCSYEIADILAKELPNFDKNRFVSEVTDGNYEGFLFPDTYFFTPNVKINDIIHIMVENFARQVQPYEEDIKKLNKPLREIIIIASIIEDEANGSLKSKRIVSGILWKRLSMDMLLQVDAPFQYYNGKNSYTLTKEDLAEDHEYNTYTNKGLPPTAITNPGLDSIRAAIAPTQTDYLYFLSDKKGNLYYAEDFDSHQSNRERYLR